MKIKVEHSQGLSTLTFPTTEHKYGQNLVLTDAEVATLAAGKEWRNAIFDIARVAIIDTHRITIIIGLDECCPTDGHHEVRSIVCHLDTRRFFGVVAKLSAKRIATEIDSANFPTVTEPKPVLTVCQMVKHPNARYPETFAKTLSHFHRHLTGDEWPRLIRRLSDLITQALVFGQGDEFYFDGRKHTNLPNGIGMNGGVILHGDRFGVHT